MERAASLRGCGGAELENLPQIDSFQYSVDRALARCVIPKMHEESFLLPMPTTTDDRTEADYMLTALLKMIKKYHQNFKSRPDYGEVEARRHYEICYTRYKESLKTFLDYPDNVRCKANIDSAICGLADALDTYHDARCNSPC